MAQYGFKEHVKMFIIVSIQGRTIAGAVVLQQFTDMDYSAWKRNKRFL